eukprot:674634-Prorocentrum_minimum.AAC.1
MACARGLQERAGGGGVPRGPHGGGGGAAGSVGGVPGGPPLPHRAPGRLLRPRGRLSTGAKTAA